MFIGQWLRSAPKPACISAHRLRARARRTRSAGQMPAPSGKALSCRYSAMASVSQTTSKPSSSSTGTRPAGLTAPPPGGKAEPSVKSKRSFAFVEGRCPVRFISTQGRIDHDE
jgi:hypothetical protein